MREAIVLAGGLGTRLRSVTGVIPKSMVQVAERPFLEYMFDYLLENNIEKVILAIGYNGEYIENYFGSEYKGIQIIYCNEEYPLGTGGAIIYALSLATSDDVFVLNGDSIFLVNLTDLLSFHIDHKSVITISVKPLKNYDRYGSVVLDNNSRVIEFKEKVFTENGLINGGVYLVNKMSLMTMVLPESFSFEYELLEAKLNLIKEYGYVENAYFRDIGIPEDYERAQHEFKEFN